jgi:hypothetical protein
MSFDIGKDVPKGKDRSEVMLETMVIPKKAKLAAQMNVVHAWNPSQENLFLAQSTIRRTMLR